MSDFYNLTKEQQAYLMHLAHKTFPSKFLSQQRARTIIHEEEEPDIYNDQELHGEYLPDDDSEVINRIVRMKRMRKTTTQIKRCRYLPWNKLILE